MENHSAGLQKPLSIVKASPTGMFVHGAGRRRTLFMILVCLFGIWAPLAAAEVPKLTPEYIRDSNPELYRQIQAAPRLPEAIDPLRPYGEYGGFFSHPKFMPDQPEEWWERSAFEYSPEYPYFLKHTHLKFSFSDNKGNDDGFALKGALYLALRKGRVSNIFGYEVDRKQITDTQGGSIDKNMQTLDETLLYEINRHLYVECGGIWQSLSLQRIDSRTIPFVGLGTFNILQDILDKKKDTLKMGLGFGRVFDHYDAFVESLIKKDSDTFNAIYLNAAYTHRFTDKFNYRQNFTLKHATEKTAIYSMTSIPQSNTQFAITAGSTYRYDWRWTNALEFNLNQYVGFLIQYYIAYDSNPWPISAKYDRELMLGLKFAY